MNVQLTRRQTFAALAGAGAVYFIPAWNETVEAAGTCIPSTPTVTEGPYWVDEKLFRSDIRTDPNTGLARAGTPLALTIALQNLSGTGCSPLAGAYVDIWHCDAKGIYSDESTYNPGGGTGNVNTTGQKFLRGYQISDDNGNVTFATIYPGWYSGRTIHIHFRVRTYSGNTMLGNFVSQIFFDEVTNDTVLAQSTYSRTTSRDTTNARDMVYQVANKERMLATVTGNNTDGYAATIIAGVTITAPAAAVPAIASGGVGSAVSGAAGVSPGSLTSIYGANFSTSVRVLVSSDVVNNMLPTSLNGVQVSINGKPAYVVYVNPTQINVLAPDDTARGAVAVTLTNSAGTSNTVTATMQEVLPALSGAVESGYTVSAAGAPGDTISLFGTGFGPANSAVATGVVFTGVYPTTNAVTVTIGSVPAEVLWAGLIGPGLYQINVTIPASLSDGNQPVIAIVAGISTQSAAVVKVASKL